MLRSAAILEVVEIAADERLGRALAALEMGEEELLDAEVIDMLLEGEIRFVRRSDATLLCRVFGIDPSLLRRAPRI